MYVTIILQNGMRSRAFVQLVEQRAFKNNRLGFVDDNLCDQLLMDFGKKGRVTLVNLRHKPSKPPARPALVELISAITSPTAGTKEGSTLAISIL